jgi:hypothetical protein
MNAITIELEAGVTTYGKTHLIKGREALTALNTWLRKNPNAPAHDRSVAQGLVDELT